MDSSSTSSMSQKHPVEDSNAQTYLAELFEQNRGRLERLVRVRLDGRLRNRFDASDVIQEAYIRLMGQREISQAVAPSYPWLRRVVLWTLVELQRRHLGAKLRDVRRERPLEPAQTSSVTGLDLARLLIDSITSPTKAAQRAELFQLVGTMLEQLEPADREILVLRHYEQLSRNESAEVLGISTEAAAKRYIRALAKLRQLIVPSGVHIMETDRLECTGAKR